VSVVQMLSSMQQIQSQIASLSGTPTSSTSSTDATSSATFDQLVSSLSSTSTPATGTGGTVTGADVVADAKKYIGVPYVLGGESTSGMDCSGLVQKTFKDLGVDIPRLVHTQAPMGTAVPSLAQAQPGDLIVFKGGGHIGIYAGNGMVIHAPYPGRTVSEQKLWVGDSGIETIRRIVPATAPAPAPATTTSTAGPAAIAAQASMQADIAMLNAISTSFGSMNGSGTDSSLLGQGTP
jgi:cell wall-associated NlpC family hydrolase